MSNFRKQFSDATTQATEWAPVIFRGWLYYTISFLPPFTDAIVEFLKKDMWPTPQRVVLGLLIGSGAGLIALRAFVDNFAHKHGEQLEKKRSNGGGTTQFYKKPGE